MVKTTLCVGYKRLISPLVLQRGESCLPEDALSAAIKVIMVRAGVVVPGSQEQSPGIGLLRSNDM